MATVESSKPPNSIYAMCAPVEGKEIYFTIWEDFDYNQESNKTVENIMAMAHISHILYGENREVTMMVERENMFGLDLLGPDRPIAIVAPSSPGRFRISKPFEFEVEELELRKQLSEFLMNQHQS